MSENKDTTNQPHPEWYSPAYGACIFCERPPIGGIRLVTPRKNICFAVCKEHAVDLRKEIDSLLWSQPLPDRVSECDDDAGHDLAAEIAMERESN